VFNTIVTINSDYFPVQKSPIGLNPLTPNDLQRRRAASPLKIKIPSKIMREKPTNATTIHSVY
jgi:hypothetical protein